MDNLPHAIFRLGETWYGAAAAAPAQAAPLRRHVANDGVKKVPTNSKTVLLTISKSQFCLQMVVSKRVPHCLLAPSLPVSFF
jgi:hypothetical protein